MSQCLSIVDKTSSLFERISESSKLLKSNGEQILAASKEQSLGVSQIAVSMSKLDENTTKNEEAAKNNSMEAGMLDQVALGLKEIVSKLSVVLHGSRKRSNDERVKNNSNNVYSLAANTNRAQNYPTERKTSSFR